MSSFISNPGAGVPYQGKAVLFGNPNPPYEVHEGEDGVPNGWAKVAHPGDVVPGDVAARYNLAEKFKADPGHQPEQLKSSVNGEPLVMVGGRAVAESSLPASMRSKPAGQPGAKPGEKPGTATAQPTAPAPHAGPNVIETKPGEPAKK